MRLHHKMSLAGLLISLFSIPLDSGLVMASRSELTVKQVRTELAYYEQAGILNDLLFKEGIPVHMTVVVSMLKEIDKNMVRYFPEGPYTRNDFIALAWIESEFKQYE